MSGSFILWVSFGGAAKPSKIRENNKTGVELQAELHRLLQVDETARLVCASLRALCYYTKAGLRNLAKEMVVRGPTFFRGEATACEVDNDGYAKHVIRTIAVCLPC